MAKKRLTVLLLAAALLLAALAVPVSAKTSFLLGDINGDGQRSAIDYIMLKRHVLGSYAIPEDALPAADLNGNGEPDAFDYLLLKRALLDTYVIPDAPQDPSGDRSDGLRFAVAFSYLFRTANHDALLELEAELGFELTALNELVVTYLASLSIDGDELLELENEIALRLSSPEEIEAFLHRITDWLKTLLPERS